MLEWLYLELWSPYIAGAGIGILCWFTFLLSDKPIGCSTAFTRTSGMIERIFRGSKVNEKPYMCHRLRPPFLPKPLSISMWIKCLAIINIVEIH